MATPKATPDYTELRNVAAPVGNDPKLQPLSDYIFVAGLPDPGNAGLQGLFGWAPESLFADDGGTVIKPNSMPPKSKGRWHRVFDGALSVKWFGAKGNGSADDTKAIQAAVLAATVSKKPGVYFSPGRYRLSQAIELTADDFTLSGTAGAVLVLEPS